MPFWQDWFDGHERMSLRGQCLQWWRWYHGTNFSARNCSVLSGISLYRVNGFCLSKAVTEFRVIFTGMYRRVQLCISSTWFSIIFQKVKPINLVTVSSPTTVSGSQSLQARKQSLARSR